jgi:hypothetical protein
MGYIRQVGGRADAAAGAERGGFQLAVEKVPRTFFHD